MHTQAQSESFCCWRLVVLADGSDAILELQAYAPHAAESADGNPHMGGGTLFPQFIQSGHKILTGSKCPIPAISNHILVAEFSGIIISWQRSWQQKRFYQWEIIPACTTTCSTKVTFSLMPLNLIAGLTHLRGCSACAPSRPLCVFHLHSYQVFSRAAKNCH